MNNRKLHSRSIVTDENADARIGAFMVMSAILTVLLILIWYIAPPPNVGIKEGQLAPDIIGESHTGTGGWEDFRLYDYINHSWVEGESGTFILLQFMDTDCPHCWSDAFEMSSLYEEFGDEVAFITVSVAMLSTSHSRAETVAFQTLSDFDGCNKDNSNCQDRPGGEHVWPYVDDLDLRAFNQYNLPGVPFHLILSPDGIVVWNSAEHPQGDPLHKPQQALYTVLGGSN